MTVPVKGGGVNGPTPARRNLAPRKPPNYDNRDYAHKPKQKKIDEAPASRWEAEDALDSHTIIRQNRRHAVPPAQYTWQGSKAATCLAALPASGLWVPVWVTRATKHPARAFLLSWLLALFSDGIERDEKGQPQCRARALDEDDRTWWRTSRSRIAAEILLDVKTADRARMALVKQGLIEVVASPDGLLIRPCARGLVAAYLALTQDPEVEDERGHADPNLEWFGSHTRTVAERNAIGTRVHDALMVLCDRKPGPALVLAHVLYWHGVDASGKSRARITRHDRLWLARSQRQLMKNPGGDGPALAGYARWLADKRYLVANAQSWSYRRDRDYGRPTLHLRPNRTGIGNALVAQSAEIRRAIAGKRPRIDSAPTP